MSDKWEAVKQANGDWHVLKRGCRPVVFEQSEHGGQTLSVEMIARNEAALRNGEPAPFRDILELPFGGHIDPPPGHSGIIVIDDLTARELGPEERARALEWYEEVKPWTKTTVRESLKSEMASCPLCARPMPWCGPPAPESHNWCDKCRGDVIQMLMSEDPIDCLEPSHHELGKQLRSLIESGPLSAAIKGIVRK
jgi:hypothetical protein